MDKKVHNVVRMRDALGYAVQRGKGIPIRSDLSEFNGILEQIRNFDFTRDSDKTLRSAAAAIRRQITSTLSTEGNGNGGNDRSVLDGFLPETFALVCEICNRVLGQTPFDVQIIAAIVLHQGKLAQMKTGEGKTLAAVPAACLNAMMGRGVHILTANDYLAGRDAEWMRKIYRFFGFSVRSVSEKTSPGERRKAYAADITYLTAKQCGFDFLRDRLQYEKETIVQRPFCFAVIDEADFIMIDEARVPMVIAADYPSGGIDPYSIDKAVRTLVPARHYTVGRAGRNCGLTLAGEEEIKHHLGCGGMHEPRYFNLYAAVHASLHAHVLLAKDVDYIVKNGSIELIDEFTGRVADNRKWPDGIQTALEVKEGLHPRQEGEVCGSITIQNLLNLYPKKAAMTATAVSAAKEFSECYGLETVIIPPNKLERMQKLPDRIFRNRNDKLSALIGEITSAHAAGRPVLVGTKSVRESEELAALLKEKGISCNVLNAKNDEYEAELIAQAGMIGAVTISTNMAGRGTDIKLGGPDEKEREMLTALGGLYVIGTNRHESVRIDDQLRGRAARQGDPGTSRFFISLEDDLILKYGILDFIPRKYTDGEPIAGEIRDARVAAEIARAQKIIEEQHSSMRKTLRRYSELIEKQRCSIDKLRTDALVNGVLPEDVIYLCGKAYASAVSETGADRTFKILRRIFLLTLDDAWKEHLAFIRDIREGIHLQRYGGKEPLLEFIRMAVENFENAMVFIIEESARHFTALVNSAEDTDFDIPTPRGPANTWTYLINDDPLPPFALSLIAGAGFGAGGAAALQNLRRFDP